MAFSGGLWLEKVGLFGLLDLPRARARACVCVCVCVRARARVCFGECLILGDLKKKCVKSPTQLSFFHQVALLNVCMSLCA